jgi:hypothetical protein
MIPPPQEHIDALPLLPQAVMSVVVTETESLMTWSRLEGLLLHWAVSRKAPPAERWELPPRGWKTLPESTVDAGGCERCMLCLDAWQRTAGAA